MYYYKYMETKTLRGSCINFLSNGRIICIDPAEITHFGLMGGVTVIYTRLIKYPVDADVTELLNRLPAKQFIRICRDFAVAPAYVDSIDNYKIYIGRYRLVTNFFYRRQLLAALETVEPKPKVSIIKYNV
jgi:DNA-binding LytR/AlgR family response regulator